MHTNLLIEEWRGDIGKSIVFNKMAYGDDKGALILFFLWHYWNECISFFL